MIHLIVLAFIMLFVINYGINIFFQLSTSEKTTLAILTTITLCYFLYKQRDEIDHIEDKFVKYLMIFVITICIFKLIEYLYLYGLKGPNSILIVLSLMLFGVISISIYLFNASL
jgi:hypothetical protein